jgi:hypothetical protein
MGHTIKKESRGAAPETMQYTVGCIDNQPSALPNHPPFVA